MEKEDQTLLQEGNVKGDEALLAILSDPESGMARAQVIWQSMQAIQGGSKIAATHNLMQMSTATWGIRSPYIKFQTAI